MKIDINNLSLRKVNISDALILYKWATEPSVRQNSINSETFSFESHIKWLENKIQSTDTIFYILMERFPIGQIRFDKHKEGWLISFSIDEIFRRQGLGFIIVKMGIEATKEKKFVAYVKKSNLPSNQIFKKLDFVEIDSDIEDTIKWIKQ